MRDFLVIIAIIAASFVVAVAGGAVGYYVGYRQTKIHADKRISDNKASLDDELWYREQQHQEAIVNQKELQESLRIRAITAEELARKEKARADAAEENAAWLKNKYVTGDRRSDPSSP